MCEYIFFYVEWGDKHVAHFSGEKHTITLRQEEGQWKIVSDIYDDFLWRTLRQKGTSPEEIVRAIDESLRAIKASPLTRSDLQAILLSPINNWKENQTK